MNRNTAAAAFPITLWTLCPAIDMNPERLGWDFITTSLTQAKKPFHVMVGRSFRLKSPYYSSKYGLTNKKWCLTDSRKHTMMRQFRGCKRKINRGWESWFPRWIPYIQLFKKRVHAVISHEKKFRNFCCLREQGEKNRHKQENTKKSPMFYI